MYHILATVHHLIRGNLLDVARDIIIWMAGIRVYENFVADNVGFTKITSDPLGRTERIIF